MVTVYVVETMFSIFDLFLIIFLEYMYLELVELLFHCKRTTKRGGTLLLLACANLFQLFTTIVHIYLTITTGNVNESLFHLGEVPVGLRVLLVGVSEGMIILTRPVSYGIVLKKRNWKMFVFTVILGFAVIPFEMISHFVQQQLPYPFGAAPSICSYYIMTMLFIYIVIYRVRKQRARESILSFLDYINPLHVFFFGSGALIVEFVMFAQEDSIYYFQREQLKYMMFAYFVIMSGYFFSAVVRAKNYREQSLALEKQLSNQIEYYKKLDEIYTDMRSFRHDFKNHLFCIESMVRENRNQEAVEYLEEIRGLSQQKLAVFDTGNLVINAMLTEKASEAQKVGANIIFTGMIPKQGIKVVDLCTIFANAVDNAVEACGRGEGQKEIKIESNVYQGYYFLNISNPYFEELKKTRNGLLETSKEDKQYHGFGLKNIKDTVKKYSGKMDINMKDGIFSLQMEMLIGREED